MFYYCKACSSRSRSLKDYVEHYRLHFNEANVKFPCALNGCVRRFKTYTAFKSHFSRDHENVRRGESQSAVVDSAVATQCPFTFCSKILESIKDFLGHLKDHLTQGLEIACPFQGCHLKFKIKTSFTSHLSRQHKNSTERVVAPHLLVNVNNETNNNATLLCPDSFGCNEDMVGETSNHVDNNDDGVKLLMMTVT